MADGGEGVGWLTSARRHLPPSGSGRARRRLALGLTWCAVAHLWHGHRCQPFAFGPAAPVSSGQEVDDAGVLLLGREAWCFNRWRAETDDVRGGASSAQFKGLTDASGDAEFCGMLSSSVRDPFASVSLQASALPEPLSEMKGLVLDISEADGSEYSVGLRMLGAPAGIQHAFKFTAEAGRLEMYFRDFQPMLQGRVQPDDETRLVLERVESITIQKHGANGLSHEPFSLVLRSVCGIPGRDLPPPPPPARKTKWTCRACGTMNFDSSDSCTRCGEGRYAEEERAASAAADAARKQQVKWECGACGQKNFASASECYKCGAPRG